MDASAAKWGIVCCSNGQPPENRPQIEALTQLLRAFGVEPVCGNCIYARDAVSCGSGRERARELMQLYNDSAISEIFDISGGDLANEVLDHLDYDRIARSPARFWGYSDLTTVLNGIYTKTGKPSVLYQPRNLVSDQGSLQQQRFHDTLINGGSALFQLSYEFVRGTEMAGIVVGGNIRCFLKLAGTAYFPDMNGKILLLEAYGGGVPQLTTYLCQLKQMGVFDKISGILLGTFTRLEENPRNPAMEALVMQYANADTPIAKTREIGHGTNAKAILIGAYQQFISHG